MKCLITGGCGFIGSHLAKRLSDLGHDVSVLDVNLSPPRVLRDAKIEVLCGDITRHLRSDSVFRKVEGNGISWCPSDLEGFDWVFHLAALADIVPSIIHPWLYHKVNVEGTLNVMWLAQHIGAKRFIYASSTSIYGIPGEVPTPETSPADPQYPYALTKWVAEQYVLHWARVYRLPALALRITTAYGPGMRPRGYGSVMKVFMAQKAWGVPFTVVGDGSQSRDFVYVEDVVEAFIKAAESGLVGEAFNVGSNQPRQVNELLGLMGGGEVHHLPTRPGEPPVTWADISKARMMLGWEPRFSLEEGIKPMLEELQEWRRWAPWTPERIGEITKKWFQCLGKEKQEVGLNGQG